jgi:hypothetical protein
MWRRVEIVLTDVSEEHIASIFRVEGKKKSALHLLCWFARGFLLVFYPEYGGDTFLRNVC